MISIVCTSEIDDTLHGRNMLQLPRRVSCSSSTMILSCKLLLTYMSEASDGRCCIALKSIPLFKACSSPLISCASAYLSNLASSSSHSQILCKSCSFSCFSSAFYLCKVFHSEMLTNIWAVDTIIIYIEILLIKMNHSKIGQGFWGFGGLGDSPRKSRASQK